MTTLTPPSERDWLDQAVAVAADNVLTGGGPFGALLVKDGELIATGTNLVTSSLDPTAHAEVVAIRAACLQLQTFKLDGCLLVASCEPCPLCLSAALWARVDRVIFAADRDDAAEAGFDDRAFYELFSTPREQWPITVQQLPGEGSTLPFKNWTARPDRVEY
jgi:tRNA(Arg) A34 adenosine deaminase TadA